MGLRRSLTLAFALGSIAAHAGLPRDARVPGGVAVIPVPATGQAAPQVRFNGASVWTTRDRSGHWSAVVGLPLSLKAGVHTLQIDDRVESFSVRHKKYPVQALKLNPAMVDPPKDVQARIERESKHLAAVRSTFSESATTDATFALPAQGRLSSRFGVARILNGQARSPHAGLDVAVPVGTPIFAPSDGVVLDAGDYYFCGKTLFIDHGNGLITMHCHLSEFLAPVGTRVKKGERVALSGGTGRATGPHLHWSVFLNAVSVEPELFLEKQ